MREPEVISFIALNACWLCPLKHLSSVVYRNYIGTRTEQAVVGNLIWLNANLLQILKHPFSKFRIAYLGICRERKLIQVMRFTIMSPCEFQ